MDLKDAINQSGKPFLVSNYSRNEFPKFLKTIGLKTGVEIGVYRGEFTKKMCEAGLEITGVDPWQSFRGQGKAGKSQDLQEDNYSYARRLLSSYKNCRLIRKTSMDAIKDFEYGSLDFVYIDGDHRFKAIADDVYEWYFRVKSGGIVSGDDYNLTRPDATHLICQVSPVIDAFVRTYEIDNFYVFDGSWMFFKH